MNLRWMAVVAVGMAVGLPGRGDIGGGLIPRVETVSLAGQRVELPQAFEGKVGVLVLGFSKASREGVTAWGKRLAVDYGATQQVPYYEMAMLAEVPRLVRGVVERSIRDSMPKPVQERFLTLTQNEAGWRAVVHYSQPDDPYVMVVDGQGRVLWETQGAATDASYTALRQQVARLRALR